ncbi:MAG: membrane protein insertase YidC, partial [Clostridia bacterium]|nr:membrane protein insertase YidC [Clostridia bacterium]
MNEFLKSILDGIHMLIPSYGWTIVAFTILVRLCLMPLDYKSRVGMRKMSKLAPKQAELQKKYAKDQEKLQRKLSELYRKENVSPMSSCWPMLLSMPILFAMFGA